MLWFNVTPFAFRFIHYIYAVLSLYMLYGLAAHFLKQRFDCLTCCEKIASFNTCRLHSVNSIQKPPRKLTHRNSFSMHEKSKFIRITPVLMAGLSFLAAILTILHILLDLWVFFLNDMLSLEMLCVRQKWSGILLFSCAFCVYLFLWIRQRVFYSHPFLKKLSGPGLNFLSWSVLFAIVFSLTSITIVYYTISADIQLDSERKKEITYSVFYNTSGREILPFKLNVSSTLQEIGSNSKRTMSCTLKSKKIFLITHLVLTMMFLYFHISLQFLFAYPVMIIRRKRKRLLLQCKVTSKASKRKGGKNSFVKPTELVNMDSDKNPSVSSDKITRSTGKNKRWAKERSASQETLVNFSSPSRTLRPTQPQISLKITPKSQLSFSCEFGVRSQNWNSNKDDEICITKVNRGLKHQMHRLLSSSDSKLSTVKHTSACWKGDNLSTTSSLQRSKRKHNTAHLRRYVWRCFFMSLLCCVSDMAAFAVNVYTQISSHEEYTNNFQNALINENLHFSRRNLNHSHFYEERKTLSLMSVIAYNGNMVINLLCMILCYDKCVSLLLPCCFKSKKAIKESNKAKQETDFQKSVKKSNL